MQDRKDQEIENPNQLQLQIWKPYSIDYVDLPQYLKTKGIAICSPNCVQIWKGRDRKTGFCRVIHKKGRAKGETFFLCQTL